MRVAGSTKALPQLAFGPGEGSTRVEQFQELHGLLRSKGYSDQAAQVTALSMLAGEEPMAQPNRRFAGIYGAGNQGFYGGGLLLPQDD
jgi:hypothetical protein